jgi:hypothetical protein
MKLLRTFAVFAALFALCTAASVAQITYTAQAGVSLLTVVPATATATSTYGRLPSYSGFGELNVTLANLAGSPSGCTIALAYEANNSMSTTATVATISLTMSNGTSQYAVVPSAPTGDNYVATYACSSAYPTAGAITVSFSPGVANVSEVNLPGTTDPCQNPSLAKSSAVISNVTTLAQIVALSAGQAIYVCGVAVGTTTAGTVTLEYGTGTNCGTGGTALTGAIPTAVAIGNLGWGGTIVTAPVGKALCLVATTAAYGVVSYVQQ